LAIEVEIKMKTSVHENENENWKPKLVEKVFSFCKISFRKITNYPEVCIILKEEILNMINCPIIWIQNKI